MRSGVESQEFEVLAWVKIWLEALNVKFEFGFGRIIEIGIGIGINMNIKFSHWIILHCM